MIVRVFFLSQLDLLNNFINIFRVLFHVIIPTLIFFISRQQYIPRFLWTFFLILLNNHNILIFVNKVKVLFTFRLVNNLTSPPIISILMFIILYFILANLKQYYQFLILIQFRVNFVKFK